MTEINELAKEKTNSIINCEKVINSRNKEKDTYLISDLNIRYSNIDNVLLALNKFSDCNIVSIGNDIVTTQSNSILREMLYKINSILSKNKVTLYLNPLVTLDNKIYHSCISVDELKEIMNNLGRIKLLFEDKDDILKFSKYDISVLYHIVDYKNLGEFNEYYNKIKDNENSTLLISNQKLYLTSERYNNKERKSNSNLILSQLYNFKSFKSIISVDDCIENFQQHGRIVSLSSSKKHFNFFKLNLETLAFDNCIQIKKRG